MRIFTLVLAAALGSAGMAFAQATGSIIGIITDESGAVVPGVSIEATNTATSQTRTAVSATDGYYSVPLLQPGEYRVTAGLSGFRAVTRQGVTVEVNGAARVDIRLTIGSLQENVVVSGQAPLVETASAALGVLIDRKSIVELPLNGRNFAQLGTLLPGVVAPPSGLGGGSGDATPGGFGAATSGFTVNGMRNQSNNFLLDGASNNDTFNTGFVLRPPPDAIQEFKILTHSYGAEYGRSAGSVVNVVTRSGSNQLAGAAWEFNRDDRLQARNFFAPLDQPKPNLKQNQFGGAAGGPIRRDRVFGFGYYEGFRNRSGVTQNIVVLTDAQRSGDFATTVIRDPLTGQPFSNNQIPAQRLDPAALRLVDQFVPRANTGGNRYVASPDATDNRQQFGARIDYQLSATQSVLARYIRSRTESLLPSPTRPIGAVSKATLQDLMVSHTHVLRMSTINTARFSYNRIGANPAVTSGLSNADYGINVPQNVPGARGLANFTVPGLFGSGGVPAGGLGDVTQPFVERRNEVVQFSDDLMRVSGVHTWKAGVDVRREHMVIAFVNRPNGDFTFNGVHTGSPVADFLLGLPSQFRRTTANTPQDGMGWLHSAYIQDELRAGENVTVTLGVRYELPLPFVDQRDALNAFHPGQQSRRFPDAPIGLVYPGDPGVPRGTYNTDKNNFAPRTGLAWDPTGTGRSSLHAAWGVFFDALAGQGDFFQNGVLAPPFTPLVEVNAPPAALTLRTPLNATSGGAPGFPPGLTVIGWGEDFASPYAHHFNLTWQQQAGQFGTEVGYVGSRGRNLPIFMEVNPGIYVAGQTSPGARLFPAFALVRPTFSVARSWYDSLQVNTRMRPLHGISILSSYTLGHARDHVSGLNIGGEQRPVLPGVIGDRASIDRALEFEKGDALFDVRHRFVMSVTAELPAPRSGRGVLDALAGGWQLNAIIQAQTGFPFTVYDPQLSIRYLTNRPNQICDPNTDAPHTVEQWFNTGCFQRRALADTAQPGSTPRGSVRGPGFARTDLSVFKTVPFADRHRLQFRAEAFNVFNQAQFRQPGNQIGTATFGRITQAEDGRVIQLAIKYNF